MRKIWKPNVTVAAVVELNGCYLLVEEQTRDGLKLNQPAGHLEPCESPVQAVIREAFEETMRDFAPVGLLGIYMSRFRPSPDPASDDVTYLRFAFVGSVSEPIAGRRYDAGIVRTLWMTVDEVRASVARHRSPLVLRCIEDHAGGKPLAPLDMIYLDPSVCAT